MSILSTCVILLTQSCVHHGNSIVAFHGLGAHPYFTWTAKLPGHLQRVNWLSEFLPEEFPGARVMTFGHNADWIHKAPLITAYETAGQFLRDFRSLRRADGKARPLLLLGHSFGGIVIKEVSVVVLH